MNQRMARQSGEDKAAFKGPLQETMECDRHSFSRHVGIVYSKIVVERDHRPTINSLSEDESCWELWGESHHTILPLPWLKKTNDPQRQREARRADGQNLDIRGGE